MAIGWGILGTGRIAHSFASDLRLLPDAERVAVGSRAQARADAFADQYDIPHRHGSYEALVADPDVDVVYVASPHSEHARHATLALEVGKHVLCEKPLTINEAQAERLIATARAENRFLMEALWTRFFPVMDDVRHLVETGALGDLHLLQADIGVVHPFDPTHRLYDPALGGGALLDLGIYPLSLAFDLFGPPDTVVSDAVIGETGVDEQCSVLFRYDDGRQVTWQASLHADPGRTFTLSGTEGRLHGERAWWKGAPVVHTDPDGSVRDTYARPFEGTGYQFEAAHVMNCLREGRTESPVMPLEESRAFLRTMDALRATWGVEYPCEG
jgi:predicted dehydrogenase